MRKAKFILVALVAVVVVGIAYAVKAQVPGLDQKGYLYNPATDQYITSSAVMGFEGVQFVISETKDCGASFGSDDAKIEEPGYTYVRFKLDGTSNFMRMTSNGVVCQNSGYHKWAVKDTEDGLIIRCIYTSTQGSGALSPFAQQGYYLTPDADGKLALVEEPTDASYWEYVSPEEYQERIENEANAAAALPTIIKKCKQLLDKPMNNNIKQALEDALATYGEGYTGKALPAALALAEAYESAAASVVAYKGILSSYEMHKAMLMGNPDALAEFEASVADILADLENGVILGNGMDEMADIATAYTLAQDVEAKAFAYETECEVNQDYVPGGNHGITIDWDAIAAELGVEKDGLKIYAVLPDGTLDETYGRGSANTDGWRDAEGNWAGWNTADNLFYVQLTGLNLDGVGCMRTKEPTKYTAEFKVVSAADPEGKAVKLTISLNVKAKEVIIVPFTQFAELTVAETKTQKVNVGTKPGYGAASNVDVDIAGILATLGAASLDDVEIYAVESDGSLDPAYKLGTTDGWRNAKGDWAQWGDASSQFYVKSDFTKEAGQLYEVGCHPDHNGAHLQGGVKYVAKFAFVVGTPEENKAVVLNVAVRSEGAPVAPVAPTPKSTQLATDGATEQYLYNVAAKAFIVGANDWNTRASINATTGHAFKVLDNGNGTYSLNDWVARDNIWSSMDCQGVDNIWVDGAGRGGSGLWTISTSEDGSFKISNNNVAGYLSVVPSKGDTKLYMSEADEAQSTWVAVSAEDYAEFQTAISAMADEYAAYDAELAYYNEGIAIDGMKELIDGTNFYTQDAYDTYYALYEEAINKHDNEEAVVVDDPSKVHGWHAGNEFDNFLLSAWTINGEQANEFDKALYINTWSVEADGKENASPMHVPFFEYWTGDDNSLGATTIEGTVTGVKPGIYAVSAVVRVRIKNGGGDTATGITFSANGSDPIDVANGRTCGDGEQFRWTFAMVNGVTVGDDGIIKVQFNVAADNNISWLSYKNVKYMMGMTPIVTEPATAINEVNANPAAPKAIFNAAGQQMKSLQKGLNIVNGKKVYVK